MSQDTDKMIKSRINERIPLKPIAIFLQMNWSLASMYAWFPVHRESTKGTGNTNVMCWMSDPLRKGKKKATKLKFILTDYLKSFYAIMLHSHFIWEGLKTRAIHVSSLISFYLKWNLRPDCMSQAGRLAPTQTHVIKPLICVTSHFWSGYSYIIYLFISLLTDASALVGIEQPNAIYFSSALCICSFNCSAFATNTVEMPLLRNCFSQHSELC